MVQLFIQLHQQLMDVGNSITRTITVYAAPSAPTAAITQPTCSNSTGTVTVSTL
jgi:hypothetical protein